MKTCRSSHRLRPSDKHYSHLHWFQCTQCRVGLLRCVSTPYQVPGVVQLVLLSVCLLLVRLSIHPFFHSRRRSAEYIKTQTNITFFLASSLREAPPHMPYSVLLRASMSVFLLSLVAFSKPSSMHSGPSMTSGKFCKDPVCRVRETRYESLLRRSEERLAPRERDIISIHHRYHQSTQVQEGQ